MNDDVKKRIETLYKEKWGQLVSLVLLRFPDVPIESAEDIVQETFIDASASWSAQAIPDNPAGWLYQVCRNKSINFLKKKDRTADLASAAMLPITNDEVSEDRFKDAHLLMLMACCHPHLTPRTQVALALRYVANVKIESIAQQLGVNLDAVEKMLYRARQKIKDETLVFSAPFAGYSEERLAIVHKVIYLIFNDGYKQAGQKTDLGKSMCEEALLLNRSLLDGPLHNSETKALQALMLFNIARFYTRYDANGNAVELEYQDRSLWNNSLIKLAHRLLLESEDSSFSPYHLEASIACMHCSAASLEDTNWDAICKYYEVLLKIYPSPFAEINYAVSLQYNRQFDKAYQILLNLYENPYLNKSYILNISLARYLERSGKKEEAKVYFEKAKRHGAQRPV